jgi:hypothetical protein
MKDYKLTTEVVMPETINHEIQMSSCTEEDKKILLNAYIEFVEELDNKGK